MPAALALLASMLWGVSDFLGGVTSRRLPALAVLGAGQAFGGVALLVGAVLTGRFVLDPSFLPWAVGAGLTGMAGLVLFYVAMAIGPMGVVSPLVGMAVIVPVGVGLLRGEQPSSLQTFGILLAVAGVLLASGPELGATGSAKPVLIAAGSMLFLGTAIALTAEGARTNALMTTTVMRVTTVVVIGILALALRTTGGIRPRDLGGLAVIGLTDAAANLSFAVATTIGLLATTAVLSSMYPVVTALMAAWFLHERLRIVQYAGVALVMTGIVMVSAG